MKFISTKAHGVLDYLMGALLLALLPMPLHLTADILAGGILALSPVLFDFGQVSHLPHTVVGIFEVVAAFLTTTVAEPSDRRA